MGQLIADVPEPPPSDVAAVGTISELCYVLGAVLAIMTLMVALYRSSRARSGGLWFSMAW